MLIDLLINYIENKLNLDIKIQSIPLSSNREAISILLDKSKPVDNYMDNSLLNKTNFKIYCKSEDSKLARDNIYKIVKIIKDIEDLECDNFKFIKAEIDTNPYFASLSTGETYVYEAIVSIYTQI